MTDDHGLDDDRNEKIDEALEETFPASDPPANTVETGIVIDPGSQPPEQPPTNEDQP